MTALRAAHRARPTPRAAVGTLTALVVALAALIFPAAALSGQLALSSFWESSGVLAMVLVIAVVGLVVAGHQPGNPIGWLLTAESVYMLLIVDAGFVSYAMYSHGHQGPPVLGPALLALGVLFAFSLTGFPLVILMFPDGKLPSRRWRWALWPYLGITAAAVGSTVVGTVSIAVGHHVVLTGSGDLPALGKGDTAWVAPFLIAFLGAVVVLWLAAIGRQALIWRGSAGERRQQLKWLASSAVVCGAFGIWSIGTSSGLWKVLILGFAALPVGIGVAILKYRLYDIDRIISRTLAYAIVTGLLVGVYAGLVLLATHVLPATGPVSVAAATLVAAALFNPLRRRVQRIVDRRFNRARYDAERTVAAFAARLQGAADLDAVRDDLLGVVAGSLEPAHLSIWVAGGAG